MTNSTNAATPSHHAVVIVGGGAAGISVAAALRRRDRRLDIAIIDPADTHYYQPGFTLVGGGVYPLATTARNEADVLPTGVTWIKKSASGFRPEQRLVEFSDGSSVGYDYLVLCPGMQLNWNKIAGLEETLGKNGVSSNYSPQTVSYTWECIRNFSGGKAVFTQPPLPIKCAGAPQKIAYLTADHLRRNNRLQNAELRFCLAADKMFSVDAYIPSLRKVADRYGIRVEFRKNLVAIDGKRKIATFQLSEPSGASQMVEEPFDFIHVTPPQSAPDFIKQSPFANADGWAEVDMATLRHPRYPEVFALGDASSAPTSKTAAAVRSQIPVVVENLLRALQGGSADRQYDGYTACPITTSYQSVLLAEFCYGGKVTPSFPLDPTKERRSMWHLKKDFFPKFYWHYMLKGRTWDIGHRPRA